MNNFVTFEGNLTKDPEHKTINESRDLAVFRMAINERISKDYEETLYIDVNAWGYQASYCKNVELSKGDRVSVQVDYKIVRGRIMMATNGSRW